MREKRTLNVTDVEDVTVFLDTSKGSLGRQLDASVEVSKLKKLKVRNYYQMSNASLLSYLKTLRYGYALIAS